MFPECGNSYSNQELEFVNSIVVGDQRKMYVTRHTIMNVIFGFLETAVAASPNRKRLPLWSFQNAFD